MKVFEYSFKTGRGKQIADVKHSGSDCRIGVHKGVDVHAGFDILTYPNGHATWSEQLTADNFTAAEAITFCTGQDMYSKKWLWEIVPTSTIIDKAIARNIGLYGTRHMKNKECRW